MPSAVSYVPPTDPERNGWNTPILNERIARREKYQTALRYYDGRHDAQVESDAGEPDDNVIVNLTKMSAERTASMLFSEMPKFEIDPNSPEPTAEEIWLEELFQDNGGLQKLIKLALRGFLSGHNFVRIKPAPIKSRATRKPSIIVLDPLMVTVFWRADDVSDVVWYELRYQYGTAVRIQDFVYNADNETWTIYTYESVQNDTVGKVVDIDTIHGQSITGHLYLDLISFKEGMFKQIEKPAIHSSFIPPIIDFSHLPNPDGYYGLGEFTQKDLQDVINRVASQMNRIVRENSDPLDVITGADVDEVEQGDGVMTIASPNAKAQRFEMKGDLTGIKGTLEKFMEIYLAVARVVLLKGEAKDLQRVTNASVRTLFLDALAKNEVLRSAYGHALTLICRVALMMGYEAKQILVNPDGMKVQVKFAQPLPTDLLEIANINAIQVNMGARSLRTAAAEIGDNWAFEKEAKVSEQEEAMAQQEAQLELQAKFAPEPAEGKPVIEK